MPSDAPVTMPVDPTRAMVVFELLHVPPSVRSDKAIDVPLHTVEDPEIIPGNGFIVIVFVAKQPVDTEVVILHMPLATPVTTPVLPPTVARPVLLLVHVPPEDEDRVVELPTHTSAVPVIGDGAGVTVIVNVTVLPVLTTV